MIKRENCKQEQKDKDKMNTQVVSFRIWPHMNNWLKTQKLSPRLLFIESCKELGYKPELK